jgi:hypothetical protein
MRHVVFDLPPDIVITAYPAGLHGCFAVRHAGRVIVTASPTPFCEAARILLAEGFPVGAVLGMRHQGADDIALRAKLGAAAKLTVDEHHNRFTKWKPFGGLPDGVCRSAVGPPMRSGAAAAVRHRNGGFKRVHGGGAP